MPVAGDSGLPRPRLTSLSHISKAHRLRNSSPEYRKLRCRDPCSPVVWLQRLWDPAIHWWDSWRNWGSKRNGHLSWSQSNWWLCLDQTHPCAHMTVGWGEQGGRAPHHTCIYTCTHPLSCEVQWVAMLLWRSQPSIFHSTKNCTSKKKINNHCILPCCFQLKSTEILNPEDGRLVPRAVTFGQYCVLLGTPAWFHLSSTCVLPEKTLVLHSESLWQHLSGSPSLQPFLSHPECCQNELFINLIVVLSFLFLCSLQLSWWTSPLCSDAAWVLLWEDFPKSGVEIPVAPFTLPLRTCITLFWSFPTPPSPALLAPWVQWVCLISVRAPGPGTNKVGL